MAAVKSPRNLQQTLDALRSSSKGRLHYNQNDILDKDSDRIANGDGTRATVMQGTPGTSRQLSRQEVGSMLNGSQDLSTLLTVNSLYKDESVSEETVSRGEYFLDIDNSQHSLLDSSERSETSDDESAPEQKVELLSPSSAEEVAIRQLNTVYNRQLQDQVHERQSAYLDLLNDIDRQFNQRFQELELSRNWKDSLKKTEEEEEAMQSARRREERLEELRQRNLETTQALKMSLQAHLERTKKLEEKRLEEERMAREKEERKKKRIREECRLLLQQVDSSEQVVMDKLNHEMFAEIEVAHPFVNKARAVAADIRQRVNTLMSRSSEAATPVMLKSCVDSLHKLTESVGAQLKQVERIKRERDQVLLQQRQQDEQRRHQEELRRQQIEQQQQEQQRQQLEMQQRRQQQQQLQTNQQPTSQLTTNTSRPVQAPTPVELPSMCCHEDTFLEFLRLNEMVKQAQEAGKQLSSAPQHKKLRMELQKAVSITINAISAVGGRHVKEKLSTLTGLIRGDTVRIGNSKVSTQGIPTATLFCQNLIAKKLVEQADSQVSSNAKAAFPFAAVMVSIMNESRDMKDLVLAYFYIQCPYLVPYYPARQEGQSTEDYHSHLGYRLLDSGELEAADLFLKRMTGYTKLIASCMISQGVDGVENQSVDMASAWMLLVRIVSLQPRPATTATVISSLLSVCGYRLIQVYGAQAKKLLQFILGKFLPAIREATEVAEVEGDGGAMERLEQSVLDLLHRRILQEPDGYIKRSFWYT